MALIQQFRPAGTVVFRVLSKWTTTGKDLLPVFGPGSLDIGSEEYHRTRGYTPTGGIYVDTPVGAPPTATTSSYKPSVLAIGSTESGVGSSLPSKPKTPGKLKPSSKKFLSGTTPYAYKPKSDERCRKGYKSVIKLGRRMCVKID